MKKSFVDLMVESARQALILVRGTVRIEALHKKRSTIPREEFDAELARIIRDTAIEYGPTFDDDCAVDQMFDNAELPN
jgi:hypothetical protein